MRKAVAVQGKRGVRSARMMAKRVRMIAFDFDGVFTDNRVLVCQDGTESVLCSRADGFGLEAARRAGIRLLVISKEKNPVVDARCRKLGLPCIQGCDDKAETLKSEAGRAGISMEEIAYLGNDINDIECLRIVGLPACVADAFPEVIEPSLHVTKTGGGHGAVREFCDFIVGSRTGTGR
jgi:YrbI family 3-deoxy-D-manno-octulosonate 8-phosphate phosphatase